MDKNKLITAELAFVQNALVSHLKKLEGNDKDEQQRSATNEILIKQTESVSLCIMSSFMNG